MKIPNGHEIIQLFETYAPKFLAMEGDKIGLQVGQLNKQVNKVLVTLDVLEEVVDEAIEKGAQLIIAHHPLIFRPLTSIQTEQTYGRVIEKLIKNNIAVYCAHTNLDVAKGGVNDLLAQSLQLQNTEVLVPTYEDSLKKLVVFVPKNHAEEIRQLLGNLGAGAIGEYSHCSFSIDGTGRFLPNEETNPYIGQAGQLEAVEEVRVETVIPSSLEREIVREMLRKHPYEEPAYDIYPLNIRGEQLGLGRIGYLREEMSLAQFAEFAKEVFQVKSLRVVGNLQDKVKKVAVLGGDGNKYFHNAIRKGADVYVTGDFYYHTAHDAMMAGLNVVDPGHHIEQVMKQGVVNKMTELCQQARYNVDIIPSTKNTDPFQFI
ncbi:Nif3-like dinuclear metal center hexameric protein [Bacillus kwashiorkori]|uniref:Nif3-like dinuclear metal center hexameric protein n=1 Tax=Bacillus kwashiorkori TaxID=1522318 RepID=UPI000784C01F|nr:Nif3-like dinuclear metal center hexameric protein [Bacillus kwashiorkori]